MTLAWYGHLKLQQTGTTNNWPLLGIIVFSWIIAFLNIVVKFQQTASDFKITAAHIHLSNSKLYKNV